MKLITPRPYQTEAVRTLLRSPGMILADDQGLGKTGMATWAARERKGPILVVSRPLNKPFWADTIRTLDPEADVEVAVQGGRFDVARVTSWFRHPRRRGYLIIHHEMLQTPTRKATGDIMRNVALQLKNMGVWDTIIVDEAHRLKKSSTQQMKSLRNIPCLYKWALSGSIQEKSPADYWAFLNWFAPKEFNSYWHFADRYVEVADKEWGGRKIVGVKNLPELAQRVAPYYLRRTKEQVQPDLPPKIYQPVPLEMYPKQKELYRKLCDETFADLAEYGGSEELFIGSDLKSLILQRRCALDPSLLNTDVPSVKVDWLLDWVQDNEEPFIVFTTSVQFADGLPVLLKGGAAISGTVAHKQRDQHIVDFNEGRLRYLVATYDTTAESINLQHASVAILLDPHPRALFMDQAPNRLHRMDIVRSPLIIQPACVGTIDEVVYEGLEKKWADIELVRAAIAHVKSVHANS